MGDITSWFISKVVGIRVNEDYTSPNRIDVKPSFISKLSHAEAYYNAPKGKISVHWERKDNLIVLKIDSADGLFGKIVLPNGFSFEDGSFEKELSSGTFIIKKLLNHKSENSSSSFAVARHSTVSDAP